MWLENTGSDDFWSINNLCFQNYWLGLESLDRWKWFEFLENAVETANERNWNEIRDFLVPRDFNRVNFCWKVVSIGQVLRGITLNLSDGPARCLMHFPSLSSRQGHVNSVCLSSFLSAEMSFLVWILSFRANWLQSLFVRFISLSKVCEQQPVPSSSYSKFWKF